jgi:GDP-D-mannose 3',5'-epimerase
MKILVAGGGGFIGSHLARRLKNEGHWVRVADWKENEYFKHEEFCNEFQLLDLRDLNNCLTATKDIEWVFNLAADMGGMGFIQSNHALILYNNTMISFNVAEAARRNGVKRFFYSSSACIYPEYKQKETVIPPLKESDAWPAQPQDAYGLEKLVTEELCIHYGKEFPMEFRIARFHNIYGPQGTWKGGREKAPAAFCRKVIASEKEFEMWGDGLQTRSFCYVDDCVEGIIRIMNSDYKLPLNLGSEEMVTMNDMAKLVMEIGSKQLNIKHIPGPEGVRGRNSDNTLIRQVLGWAPGISLREGLTRVYPWIKAQIEEERKNGGDIAQYGSSKVVTATAPSDLKK